MKQTYWRGRIRASWEECAGTLRSLRQDKVLVAQCVLAALALASYAQRPRFHMLGLYLGLAALAALTVLARAMAALAEPAGAGGRPDARRLASASVFVLGSALAAAAAVHLAPGVLARHPAVALELMKLRDILLFSPGEYLFYLGVALAALQLAARRRFVTAAALAVLAVGWVAWYRPATAFVRALGVDSFSELDGFSLSEARFWLSTLSELFRPEVSFKRIAFYLVFAGLAFAAVRGLLRLLPRGRGPAFASLCVLLVAAGAWVTVEKSLVLFVDNSEDFLEVKRNFAPNARIAVRDDGAPVDVLVYIGESTSALNMGIYGYPRDTTPRLAAIEREDAGLVRFENVLATHTHTSWSLLEALSVGFDPAQDFLPINERRRMSVADLFAQGGIRPDLVSNQGSSGSWNTASTVIFARAKRHFSTRSALFGNDEYKLERPWDHELFDKVRELDAARAPGGKRLVFFHSYAGHGPYSDTIPPEFRKPLDDALGDTPPRAIVGLVPEDLPGIDAYDAAVRYVDQSVARAIVHTRKKAGPAILVYFSDHGDAVYAARGHDSTRFVHEMARVPFLVYFNEAARQSRPELFRKYRRLAEARATATLAQLPWTLMDLAGVQPDGPDAASMHRLPVIGERYAHPPIALRETAEGITYVNIEPSEVVPPALPGRRFIDVTDHATRFFAVHAQPRAASSPHVCYHASNTYAKALRGALVADCLEADFVVQPDGAVSVHHPPQPDIGFDGAKFAEAARGRSIWVDAKNLLSAQACDGMADYLQEHRKSFRSILVEFPPESLERASALRACSARLRKDGIALSYYVPTDLATACAAELGKPGGAHRACLALERRLRKADESGLFTDVSYDYRGRAAVDSFPFLARYARNTWSVRAQDFAGIGPQGFRNVILNTEDPNSP